MQELERLVTGRDVAQLVSWMQLVRRCLDHMMTMTRHVPGLDCTTPVDNRHLEFSTSGVQTEDMSQMQTAC